MSLAEATEYFGYLFSAYVTGFTSGYFIYTIKRLVGYL